MASQPSSFSNEKDLKFVFTLGSWMTPFSSGSGSSSVITLRGMRASVSIDNGGGAMMGTLYAQIFGVSLADINQLTSTQWMMALVGSGSGSFSAYTIQVYAIDGSIETLLYNGTVINAFGDFSAMPQVSLTVQAMVGYEAMVNPVSPTSISSASTVGTVMAQIAKGMGFLFENSGQGGNIVNAPVAKGSYFGNTYLEQARSLQSFYHFWMYLDPSTNPPTLAIVPMGSARQTEVVPLISPSTGLIGYPLLNPQGITFESIFNPNILLGGMVELQSSLVPANGLWSVTSVSHHLSSITPGGPWGTSVQAVTSQIGSLSVLP